MINDSHRDRRTDEKPIPRIAIVFAAATVGSLCILALVGIAWLVAWLLATWPA